MIENAVVWKVPYLKLLIDINSKKDWVKINILEADIF